MSGPFFVSELDDLKVFVLNDYFEVKYISG